jgi:hypothetical protein
MRIPPFALALALAGALPVPLVGQARYTATVGATGGTKLLHDRIFQDIRIAQTIAPTLTVGATLPVSKRERVGLEVSLGSARARTIETGFPTVDGPAFRTLGVTLGVDGPLFSRFTYHGAAGLVKYFADKKQIFRQGGPMLLVLVAGADYHLPMRGPVGFLARIRYDYQRFSTDELRATGFTRTQDVHRIGIGLGLEYPRP